MWMGHLWKFPPKHHNSPLLYSGLRCQVLNPLQSLQGMLAYVNALCPLGTRGWEMRLRSLSNKDGDNSENII